MQIIFTWQECCSRPNTECSETNMILANQDHWKNLVQYQLELRQGLRQTTNNIKYQTALTYDLLHSGMKMYRPKRLASIFEEQVVTIDKEPNTANLRTFLDENAWVSWVRIESWILLSSNL